eukprot:TRINITY_DN187_c0_g1_i1.p1 TRINITY_DN187_c0_g1~~TRINITY_DN187_c0_g1_i1.p1  ORF type:complete len:283 (+),score=66.81 TRINITY_DN187_c0_g1_i1:283-1131(+)
MEEISSDLVFSERLQQAEANKQKLVVDFTASWCGPCQQIAPYYKELSEKYKDVTFLKVDIDKCKLTSLREGVQGVPTFHFYCGKTLVNKMVGAKKEGLLENVKNLADKSFDELVKQSQNEANDGDKDLSKLIDMSRSECLNYQEGIKWETVFGENEVSLKSDCDAQILFNIGFKNIVSLKTIKFTAPKGSGPKVVKLFVNKLNLGFSEAEDYEATQTLKLSEQDLSSDSAPIKLDSVKFIKTDILTIFVASNLADEDVSVISKISLHGRSTGTFGILNSEQQ